MFTVNHLWYKWILRSITKHFKDMADNTGIYFHIGDNFTAGQNAFIELKVDGPIISQLSRNYFRLLVGVRVFFSTDDNDNYQASAILSGLIASYFSEICLLNDEDEVIGRLLPNEEMRVNDFGIVRDTKIKQGSVESVYEVRLQGN